MEIVLSTTSLLLLLLVFQQDMKYRAVTWILFPLIGVLNSLLFIYRFSFDYWLTSIIQNCALLLIIIALMLIWFRIRGVNIQMVFRSQLGIGDILFFFVLAISIPFPDFAIVFVGSLIVSLIAALVLFKTSQLIPLAGLQALVLIPYLLFGFISDHQLIEHILPQ